MIAWARPTASKQKTGRKPWLRGAERFFACRWPAVFQSLVVLRCLQLLYSLLADESELPKGGEHVFPGSEELVQLHNDTPPFISIQPELDAFPPQLPPLARIETLEFPGEEMILNMVDPEWNDENPLANYVAPGTYPFNKSRTTYQLPTRDSLSKKTTLTEEAAVSATSSLTTSPSRPATFDELGAEMDVLQSSIDHVDGRNPTETPAPAVIKERRRGKRGAAEKGARVAAEKSAPDAAGKGVEAAAAKNTTEVLEAEQPQGEVVEDEDTTLAMPVEKYTGPAQLLDLRLDPLLGDLSSIGDLQGGAGTDVPEAGGDIGVRGPPLTPAIRNSWVLRHDGDRFPELKYVDRANLAFTGERFLAAWQGSAAGEGFSDQRIWYTVSSDSSAAHWDIPKRLSSSSMQAASPPCRPSPGVFVLRASLPWSIHFEFTLLSLR
ncbi:hypothetical protein CYMTET_5372 [Cymbomonas tetramitiformis]|uniref:Uncharacterized protein n=1 Tax=Cymbomonas tetramitiformis TaxID=36881 RepID=A0AAE0LJJ5_9CHLO|nr:hypothetical protein CYMTET_5372 [Cymbomonas tetramitiformis]